MTNRAEDGRGRRARSRTASIFRQVEIVLYTAVAVALAAAGAALFVDAIRVFISDLGDAPLTGLILDLLDGLLLVFIVSELLHTVRTVIDENVLRTEPFLVVGIVAVIRRLIVISAEADEFVGEPQFADMLLEIGALVATVLGLGLTIFLLRRSTPDR